MFTLGVTLLATCLLLLPSCQTPFHDDLQKTALRDSFNSDIRYDPLYISYPKLRIDNLIQRVCILGSGEGARDISEAIRNAFRFSHSGIEVMELGGLDCLLGGNNLKYRTGLSAVDSQTLSQVFRVDHVVLFEEEASCHQDYINGGRRYVRVNMKIVDTKTGKRVYQTRNEWGEHLPDPRPTYASISLLANDGLRSYVIAMLQFELRYAIGGAPPGIGSDPSKTGLTVGAILRDSPAERAGIRRGDKILSANGSGVSSPSDFAALTNNVKQGDTQKIELERNGMIVHVEVHYPVIPQGAVEEEPKKNVREKYPGMF
jgi:hypothetical protein